MLPNMSKKLPNPTVKSNNPTEYAELHQLECCMLLYISVISFFNTDTYYSNEKSVNLT
jgi:hypothetical protein